MTGRSSWLGKTLDDKYLHEITRRKQPRRFAHLIGDLLDAQSQQHLRIGLLGDLSAAIREVTDPQFQEHCGALQFRRGVLVIGVDDPGLVYWFRRQYLFLLREHLSRVMPQAGVREIQFRAEYGRGV